MVAALAVDRGVQSRQPAQMEKHVWPAFEDADNVERLIVAMQQAVGAASKKPGAEDQWSEVSAPDLTHALMAILANILESHVTAATPSGMRQLSEAAAKELNQMMKDARRLRIGEGTA